MLKPVDKLPEGGWKGGHKKELRMFCDQTIADFVTSDSQIAMVVGFPDDDYVDYRKWGKEIRRAATLRQAIKGLMVSGVKVVQRREDIFLVKDVVD